MAPLRPLVLVVRGGAAGFILLVAALHVVSREFDPSSRLLSEYMLGEAALLMKLAFLSVAVSQLGWPCWRIVRGRPAAAGLPPLP